MAKVSPAVYIVDDEEPIRTVFVELLSGLGYSVHAFASAEEFLAAPPPKHPACLLLDVCMPGMDGLKLQELLLTSQDRNIPIIFMSGKSNIPMSVKAMKAGAVDFLIKPFFLTDLERSVAAAIEKNRQNLTQKAKSATIKKLLGTLTPREYATFILVATGMPNKQVADRLNISEKTVKIHRARVMAKMQTETFADLVRLAQEPGIKSPG